MKTFQPGELILKEAVKSKTSNNVYEIYIFDNCLFCTCPAGGKKQICKHVIEIIHKNFDFLKEKCPDFLKKVMHAIEIKGDNSISREDKLKEYAKVIYLNKEIVDISRKNIDGLIKSDIEELAMFKPIVENYMLFSFYEFLRLSKQSLFNIFFAKKEDILIKLEQCGFIKLYPVTYDDFIKNVSFKIADLKDMLNNANISYPKNSKKNELFEIAKNNALFETKMQSYTLLTATELFTTSKDIISFLYHGRTENSSRKKFLNIIFLREDYNFVMKNG